MGTIDDALNSKQAHEKYDITYSTYLPRCEVVQTKQRYLVVRLNFVII